MGIFGLSGNTRSSWPWSFSNLSPICPGSTPVLPEAVAGEGSVVNSGDPGDGSVSASVPRAAAGTGSIPLQETLRPCQALFAGFGPPELLV